MSREKISHYGYQTHVGAWTFINFGLMAIDVARIDIGDDATSRQGRVTMRTTRSNRHRPTAKLAADE